MSERAESDEQRQRWLDEAVDWKRRHEELGLRYEQLREEADEQANRLRHNVDEFSDLNTHLVEVEKERDEAMAHVKLLREASAEAGGLLLALIFGGTDMSPDNREHATKVEAEVRAALAATAPEALKVGDRVRYAAHDPAKATVGQVVNTHPEKGVLVQWPDSAGQYVKPSWCDPTTLATVPERKT